MPLVSVIIPTYNQSKLVKEAITSVLQQSFKDFEIIVIDDGSKDETRSVVKSIKNEQIKYLFQENKGATAAINLGLTKSAGQYIAFLDHDDLWPKHYLETMLNHLELQTDFGLAYASIMLLSEDSRKIPFAKNERYKSGWLTNSFFRGGPCVLLSASILRREILNGFFLDETLRAADNDAFLRLSVKTPFLFVPGAYILRREIPGSLSKSLDVDDQCKRVLSYERFYYVLGGNKYVSSLTARRSFSHKYRRAAKNVAKGHNRSAAIIFIKRAIRYYPLDLRLYIDLFKTIFLSKKNDPNPNWQMLRPLPTYIIALGKKTEPI